MPTVGYIPDHDDHIHHANCPGHTENHGADLCQYRHEINRQASFDDFPLMLGDLRAQLPSNGFFYTGEGDIVECFMCHVKLRNWPMRNYNIELNHKIFSGDCPLLANREIAFAGNIVVNDFIVQPGVLSRDQEGTVTYLQLALPFSMMQPIPPNEAPNAAAEPDFACMICYANEAENLVLPCGHLGICRAQCLNNVREQQQQTCPFCRQQVYDIINVNLISRTCMRCNDRASDVCIIPCNHVCLCHLCFLETQNCPTCHVSSMQNYKIFVCT